MPTPCCSKPSLIQDHTVNSYLRLVMSRTNMLEHINIQDPLEIPAIKLFEKMVRNVSLKPLAILEKRSILNA